MFARQEGADGAEYGFLQDQSRQLEVQVSDGAFWVGESDQLLGDIGWPLEAPDVVLSVFVLIYSDPPPGTQAQSSSVSKIRCGPVDQLRKVCEAVCHIGTQVVPAIVVLVELGR